MCRLEADDWRLWREVRLCALGESPAAFGSVLADWQGDGDTEERWRDRFENVEFNVVALAAGRPIGCAGGLIDADGTVELISMWVAPQTRGSGVGDALIGAVGEWALAQSAPELRLAVRQGNQHAISLYERTGFVRVGTHPDDPTEFLMIRAT